MMRRALVVGINKYATCPPLFGCVRDATELAASLSKHGDGSPNFDVRLLTSDDNVVTSNLLSEATDELFSADADVALFYFAGHGAIGPGQSVSLVSQDGKPGSLGLSLTNLVGLANEAHKRIKSVIIILDSCHSGGAGELPGFVAEEVASVGKGVIVLSAAHKDGYANEVNGRGIFTDILVDGLQGTASDILGSVTPAAIYALVDQTLGSWEQRPVFKANVQHFVSLRTVAPKIDRVILRELSRYFPTPSSVFALDPTFEPDRNNIPIEFRDLPINDENVRIFKNLQKFNRFGLVVPVDVEHMYDAAIMSTGCKLTASGAHYRNLAELGRI
jgi:uncharacterized caspase-like protein